MSNAETTTTFSFDPDSFADDDTLLYCARAYVARGFSVIPLRPRDKRPALDSWTDFQKRKPTEEELSAWFGGNGSRANIGIVTGWISGIVVLDLDSQEALKFAEENNFPATPRARTGKGYHCYYGYPENGVRNFQG
ncbi:MAG: hypothetical protein GTO24_15605, partial [candidate division Zixibacteria bacterium]|nr:hypothetical protein [candidate division Zixibacteria bacterium]